MNRDNNMLERVVLGDQVKEHIMEAILNGDFKPGDRLVASSLARRLGVSQAPVREALRDLVLLGFIETEPFKGTSVRSFTAKELYEIYTVRAALESLAARLAAENLTDEHIETLQHILDEMIESAQQHDEKGMVRLDNRFHETILEISDNQLLHQLWKTLQFGYWTIVTTRTSNSNLEELARRHEDLLDALTSRNPQKASAAMRRHIEDLGKPPEAYSGGPKAQAK
ncbi:MAG: GntR family transcriptional regulator [Anaerolineae bacterium]|nr:GntR family transcriptional regulator [Anaerolineae bacterium]